ncbi:MAG: hypothetical protein NC131_19890, partial [Roseburia sp.]|nr:hypothetical protein [Roseburia sp.]
MKDFASYQGKNSASKESADWMNEAKKLADSFHGKGEGELMKAIYDRAVEGKRNGTLTNGQIDAFYAQFSPMLDGAKRKKLQKIVEQL